MIFPELSRPFTALVTSLHHFVPSVTVTKRCVTYWQAYSRAFLTLILKTRDCTMPKKE